MRDAFLVDVDKFFYRLKGGRRSLSTRVSLLVLNSELHCVACYRLGQWTYRLRAKSAAQAALPMVLYKVWHRWVTHLHHAEIDHNADIGPGFFLMHRTGVTIGPCRIGANSVIHQFATIGQRVAAGDQSVPQIGDNVWVGPGAIITGGITIGNGVTISAGTVLSKSVPDNCLVAGNPGRILAQDYDNESMISYALPERFASPRSA
ncbi:MAG: serine O-acetyltransferase [Dermatophilaceae bacterium]